MSGWDPAQYEKFKKERSRPFFDLMALLQPAPGARVVDLGCGTGELTRALHRHVGAADTLGIDSSPEMLARAAAFAGEGLRFQSGDVARFDVTHTYDIVFSNAALHWIPDHPTLFARLARAVHPGGQLAVQVPANDDHPAHLVARAVATEEPFRSAGGLPASAVLAPERYSALLHALGFQDPLVRLHVYGHLLPDREEVLSWLSGTTLTPLRASLDDAGWADFLARYRAALLPRLPDERPFFFTFKRIFLWARQPA